jgi:biotin operon repressor
VNGELALTESEVAKVVNRLRSGGFKIAAVHNHLMAETPRVMFLHFSGQGNGLAMARNIRSALTQTGTPLTVSPPAPPTVNWSTVTAVLGKPDQQQGTVAEFSFARRNRMIMGGTAMPPEMGVRSEVEMQMSGASVATTGELILVASEIQPVVDTLQKYGITVEAIHNHTLTESPRTFYLHFWGVGSPASMARGVRAALGKTNSVLPK